MIPGNVCCTNYGAPARCLGHGYALALVAQ